MISVSQRLAERVAACGRGRADLVVVVELAVLGGQDRAVLVRERLVAAVDVDDAEPADAERVPGAISRPRSFGPRWTMASVIASRTSGGATSRGAPSSIWITPQIPHTSVQRIGDERTLISVTKTRPRWVAPPISLRGSCVDARELPPSRSPRGAVTVRRLRAGTIDRWSSSPGVLRSRGARSHRRRQPPPVRQGRGRLAPAARGGRRGAGPHRPALRRRALARVLRRARAAAARAPVRARRRVQHRADRADAGRRWRRCWRPRRRTSCSSTATRTRRWRARWRPRRPGCRSRTSRPGCARTTARCRRSSTAC